jgi:endonuclease G, mitochondrial
MKVLMVLLLFLIPFQNVRKHDAILYQKSGGLIVEHKSYVLAYDTEKRTTLWTSYILTKQMVKTQVVKRKDNFNEDPKVKNSPSPSDYRYSGYDQGHLVNAQDMRFDDKAQTESFYMTNMLPQAPAYNRGIWLKTENLGRKWAVERDTIIIISGALFLYKDIKYIGANKIPVPSHCYKIFYDPETHEAIAFIIKNEGSNKDVREYIVTINSIEKLTKIDFLHTLDDKIENKIEASRKTLTFTFI